MVISIIARLLQRRREEEFNASLLGQSFTRWKIAYGFALHGNYTFDLPLAEIRRRWDDAHDAEAGFVRLLSTLSSLIPRSAWTHIIEAEIANLETERELVCADGGPSVEIRMAAVDQLLQEARSLLAEAYRMDKHGSRNNAVALPAWDQAATEKDGQAGQ